LAVVAEERDDELPKREEVDLVEEDAVLADGLLVPSLAKRAVVPVPLVDGRTFRSAAAFASLAVEPVARDDDALVRLEALGLLAAEEVALVEPSGTTLVLGLPGPLVAEEEAVVELPLVARVADDPVDLVDADLEVAVFFTDFSSLFEF